MIGPNSTFADIVRLFANIFDAIVVFLVALIVVFLFWRILSAWFFGGGDQAEVERGRRSVLIGLLVLVVVLGLWGIVALVRFTFFGA